MFWTTQQLLAAGKTQHDLAEAVRDGTLLKPRRGHYAAPDAAPELVRSVRVGGVATATTAAPHHGVWAPPDEVLHVYVAGDATRLRSPNDASMPLTADRDVVCVHWGIRSGPETWPRLDIASPLTMLEHAFECRPAEHALAMLDSALHERLIRTDDLPALTARVPAGKRGVVRLADSRAESGLESIVRYLLFLAGIVADVQVDIPGVGRVDLLIGGWLIIELDGRAFHSEARAFSRDRDRDAAAAGLRYRTLRFTYKQVMTEWPVVLTAVRAALAG